MGSFFGEIKRRKVFRVAAAYAVVAWLIVQVVSAIGGPLDLPGWFDTVVILLLAIGFPVAVILAWAFEVTPQGIKREAGAESDPAGRFAPAGVLTQIIQVLVLVAVGFLVFDQYVRSPPQASTVAVGLTDNSGTAGPGRTRRYFIDIGPTTPSGPPRLNTLIALSPDGEKLAYVVQRPGSNESRIYVRDLDELSEPRVIAGVEDAGGTLLFSPDGESLLFAGSGLSVVPVRGGRPRELTPSVFGGSGAFWTPDDHILYSNENRGSVRLERVTAAGGTAERLELIGDAGSLGPVWPYLLPDGTSLLFTNRPLTGSAGDGRIDLLTLATGDVRTLIEAGYNARYVPTGHIVFMRAGDLWAVPFDAGTKQTTGPEVPVIQGVQTARARGQAIYAFSDDGLLVYLPGSDTQATGRSTRLLWLDANGDRVPLGGPGDYRGPTVSPDGKRIAVEIVDTSGSSDIWTIDLEHDNARSRLTFDRARDSGPVWSPDGSTVVFGSDRDGGGLWSRAADGTGQAERLLGETPDAVPLAFTPDGEELVYAVGTGLDVDLYMLSLNGQASSRPLLQGAYAENMADISPDGRWIAYVSNERSDAHIYIRPFPVVEGGRWEVSEPPGLWPRWSKDGRTLYLVGQPGGSQGVWSVSVDTSTGVPVIGSPRRLASGVFVSSIRFIGGFDILPDASRYLVVEPVAVERVPADSDNTQLVAVENWFDELKRLAPPQINGQQ